MIRLYYACSLKSKELIILKKEIKHYLLNVMRLKQNDKLHLFNEKDGEFEGVLIDSNTIAVEKHTEKPVITSPKALAFCLIKQHRLNFLIEKATELSVSHLYPLISQNTQVKNFNIERYQKISIEAAEQSGRFDIPHIYPQKTLKKFCDNLPNDFQWHFGSTRIKTSLPIQKSPGFIIGPEGGFSKEEERLLEKICTPLSMGRNVLRAETAALWTLSQENQ